MPKPSRDPIPPLEWTAAALGLLAALVLLAIIGREAIAGNERPMPVLKVEVERVAATAAGHVVEFKVRNLSEQTAAAVHVEGTIRRGADDEISSATIDYVPGRSESKGGLLFAGDPRGKLELRVTGYEVP